MQPVADYVERNDSGLSGNHQPDEEKQVDQPRTLEADLRHGRVAGQRGLRDSITTSRVETSAITTLLNSHSGTLLSKSTRG